MDLNNVPVGANPPYDVNVIIENSEHQQDFKYEFDKAAGCLVLDRCMNTGMTFPGNYGFVPHTLAEDGDPIDVLVLTRQPIARGVVAAAKPVAVLNMEDEAGKDPKIIAVLSDDLNCPRFRRVDDLADLEGHDRSLLEQIRHFFKHYKDLETGKVVTIPQEWDEAWGDADEARRLIQESIERYDITKAQKLAVSVGVSDQAPQHGTPHHDGAMG